MADVVYYVDNVKGSVSGTGTRANPFESLGQVPAAITATVTTTDKKIIIRIINNGTNYTAILESLPPTNTGLWNVAADVDVEYTGWHATENKPDLVTVLVGGGGAGNFYHLCQVGLCKSLLVRYLRIVESSQNTVSYGVILPLGTGFRGGIKYRYCLFEGATAGADAGTRSYLIGALDARDDFYEVRNCAFLNWSRYDAVALEGTTQNRIALINNIYIYDLSHRQFRWLISGPGTSYANDYIQFIGNTIYINDGTVTSYDDILEINTTTGDLGHCDIYNNVLYVNTQVGTSTVLNRFFAGQSGSTATFSSGTIGNNLLYTGTSLDEADVLAWYEHLPFDPDDGTKYTTDVDEYGITLNEWFYAPDSTFKWVPASSQVILEVPYDLRLVANLTAGLGGVLPGAYPAVITLNGSGDLTTTTAISRVEGIFDWHYSLNQGKARQTVICASNNIYTDDGRHFLTARAYDLKSPARYSFVTMNDMLIIMSTNPTQHPLKMVASSRKVSPLENAPNMSYAVEHYSRIIGAGMPEAPSYIYASKILEPEVWDFGGRLDDPIRIGITVDDGQKVTGLSPTYYGDLYVFKEGSISRITGQWADITDLNRIEVSSTRGCISHHTIKRIGNDLLFWSDQGCHSLQTTIKYGDVEGADISFPIRNTFRSLVDPNALDEAFSVNYHDRDMYITWFRSRGSADPDIAFVYHYGIQQWTAWNYDALCAAEVVFDNGGQKIWTGNTVGLVEEWPGPQPSTSVVMATGGNVMGDAKLLKNYEEMQVHLRPTGDYQAKVTMKVAGDDSTPFADQTFNISLKPRTGDVLGDFTLDESELTDDNELLVFQESPSGARGRAATFTFTQDNEGEGLEILGYAVRASRKGS